jgi:hypothetical protein
MLAGQHNWVIYHSTNGSKVSATSTQYTGPFILPNSATISAAAIMGGLSSLYASGAYALSVSVTLNPRSVALAASQTEQFAAPVLKTEDTVVSWSLSPAIGSISATGVYTAPCSITPVQMSTPVSIAIDGSGNIWIANNGSSTVSAFTNSGIKLAGSPFSGAGTSSPVSIAVTPK